MDVKNMLLTQNDAFPPTTEAFFALPIFRIAFGRPQYGHENVIAVIFQRSKKMEPPLTCRVGFLGCCFFRPDRPICTLQGQAHGLQAG